MPHYDDPGSSVTIETGMTFTIEPMLTLGTINYDVWPDGWTAVTKDRKRTAQFEHTILVTEDGHEILTLPVARPAPPRRRSSGLARADLIGGCVIEAVVFDMDGVLIDSEPVWERVRRRFVADRGGRWPADAQDRMMGMSTAEWSAYLRPTSASG